MQIRTTALRVLVYSHLLILASALVTLGFAMMPGGRFNQHQWMSDMYSHHISAEELRQYQECLKATGGTEAQLLCISPTNSSSSPLTLNFNDVGSLSGKVRHDCWNIDFCVRHSEVRVRPCRSE